MTNRPSSLPITHYALLIGIILLAFFLRVWRLPDTPPGLWYDEAYYAMDAAWLLDGGPWQLFFEGNNGREPMYIYLQALLISIFGATPLTARLAAPLLGTLTVPLVYVLARRLMRSTGWPALWVAVVATAGLASSFWHVGLSRGGYRGILLPLATALLFYLFWRGWQERSLKLAAAAGIVLGLSQYTYLAARALPLVFAVFAVVWTGQLWRRSMVTENRAALRFLWLELALMAIISMAVFAPLGWLFFNRPALFSARTGDVLFSPETLAELLTQLAAAIRLFIDSGDPNWRHHLPGRPMLGWLGWLGFWPGLFVCLRQWRQASAQFLLAALAVLFLPALLSLPPVHALRLSALLPVYYLIFAIGLVGLGRWLTRRWFSAAPRILTLARPVAGGLALVILLELGLTVYDYFGRWAQAEETYVEYNAPLVDFVEQAAAMSRETAVMLPFQIYVHPTTRYLLRDRFREQPAPASLSGPVTLVSLPDNFRMLNVANIPELPAFVWLRSDERGQGVVYVSRPPRAAEQRYLQNEVLTDEPTIYRDRFGRELAYFRPVAEPGPILPMFTQSEPLRSADLTWAGLAQLTGYEVTPPVVEPGRPVTLNLYWRSLTNGAVDYRLFLQIIDRAGQPVTQWEGHAFREDMYRWRPQGILPTQHTLWLGPEVSPGPYLVRMGFFDDQTGQRLPLTTETGQVTDQVQLGLFYVGADDEVDPRAPAVPLDATFADAIRLTGVTLPDVQDTGNGSQAAAEPLQLAAQNSALETVFHWQAIEPTGKPMTVFLQLLDDTGEVLSGWDSQPFNGLYPTSRWSPGEVITDTFLLPLPPGGLPPGQYRLITGFYDFDTGQRLLLADGRDFAELARLVVQRP